MNSTLSKLPESVIEHILSFCNVNEHLIDIFGWELFTRRNLDSLCQVLEQKLVYNYLHQSNVYKYRVWSQVRELSKWMKKNNTDVPIEIILAFTKLGKNISPYGRACRLECLNACKQTVHPVLVYEAAGRGCDDVLRAIIERNNITPLSLYCWGYTDDVKHFARAKVFENALIFASRFNQRRCIKVLLKIVSPGCMCGKAFKWAAYNGSVKTLELLKEKAHDQNNWSEGLPFTVRKGHIECVKYYMAKSNEISNYICIEAFEIAIQQKHLEIGQIILSRTSLHLYNNNIIKAIISADMAKLLEPFQYRLSVCRNSDFDTPLINNLLVYAAENGSSSSLMVLLNMRRRFQLRVNVQILQDGVHRAVENEHIHCIHILLAEIKRIFPRHSIQHNEALLCAARMGNLTSVRLLIPVSTPTVNCSEAIQQSWTQKHMDCVKELLPHSISRNVILYTIIKLRFGLTLRLLYTWLLLLVVNS